MFVVLEDREEAGLAQPIPLAQFDVRQRGSDSADERAAASVRRRSRSSRDSSDRTWRNAGNSISSAIIVGTSVVRCTRSRWTTSQNARGLNFGMRDLAGPRRRGREHERQVEDVKHGRGVQIYAALARRLPVVHVVDIRQHVGVRHNHALRDGPSSRWCR